MMFIFRDTNEPGNVGSYMLELNQVSALETTSSLGFMMMELMEPETASGKPNMIVLMRPERWSREIRDFQTLTQRARIEELLGVS